MRVFDSRYHTTLTSHSTSIFLRNHHTWYSFVGFSHSIRIRCDGTINFYSIHNYDCSISLSRSVVPIFFCSDEVLDEVSDEDFVSVVSVVVGEVDGFDVVVVSSFCGNITCSDIVSSFTFVIRFSNYSSCVVSVGLDSDDYYLFHILLL